MEVNGLSGLKGRVRMGNGFSRGADSEIARAVQACDDAKGVIDGKLSLRTLGKFNANALSTSTSNGALKDDFTDLRIAGDLDCGDRSAAG